MENEGEKMKVRIGDAGSEGREVKEDGGRWKKIAEGKEDEGM